MACKNKKGGNNSLLNSFKPKANVVETKNVIATVISEVNLVTGVKGWMIDSGATNHICANQYEFSSYTSIGESTKCVYIGDNRAVPVLAKGKYLKLTSGKVLSLFDVLHVPLIKHNLVLVQLFGKTKVKASFDGGIVTLFKHDIYVRKGYLN